VILVEQATEALRTVGVFRPVIEINTEILADLDDRALLGALLHEAEHLRAYDPLRYLLGSVCLSLNPLARLLRTELGRWVLAREVACDRAAVQSGAEPLSLAAAILVAARPNRPARPCAAVCLAGGDVRFVRLRIGLLLAYDSARHLLEGRKLPLLNGAAIVLVATVLLPHAFDAWPLDGLHPGIESVLMSLGIG
jgi:beta-lactamase regulating signal transducer with metallopeptidase domain